MREQFTSTDKYGDLAISILTHLLASIQFYDKLHKSRLSADGMR